MKIEKKYSVNLSTLLIIGALILSIFLTGFYVSRNIITKANDEKESEIKLKNALADSLKFYKNQHGEDVAEKLTLQATIKQVSTINNKLNDNQKELLARVKAVEKEKSIINAALIITQFKLDSIRNGNVIVDTLGNKIYISDSITDIEYKFEINNVKPAFPGIKPVFLIKNLTFNNKQFIEFHWGDKKEGYPISFSVSNSNQYFKTINIESYAIPELNKPTIKPNGWEKLGKFFKGTSNTFIIFGIGAGVGAATVLLLVK